MPPKGSKKPKPNPTPTKGNIKTKPKSSPTKGSAKLQENAFASFKGLPSDSKLLPNVKYFPFASIKSTGMMETKHNLEITVQKSTHVKPVVKKENELCRFLFCKGKQRIDAVSLRTYAERNYNLLQEGKSYIIRGGIEIVKRDKKYSKSSTTTSKFELKLWKIEIVAKLDDLKYVPPVINYLAEVNRHTGKNKNLELQNLSIKSGRLYRYLGCKNCTTKISFPDKEGKFFCSKCPMKNGEIERRVCMVLKDIKLSDIKGDSLENIVCYDKDCQKLLGKKGDDFSDDLEAQNKFKELVGAKIDAKLCTQKKKVGDRWGPSITCTDIKVTLRRDTIYTDSPDTDGQGPSRQVLKIRNDNLVEQNKENKIGIVPYRRIDKYKLTSKPKGLALVINNTNFPKRENHKVREGSGADAHNVKFILDELGYPIYRFEDVTAKDLQKIIIDFKDDLKILDVDSCIVVIMSHGQNNEIQMADSQYISIYGDLVSKFSEGNFKEFVGKPKIFIIQACQDSATPSECSTGKPENLLLSDVLVCHSTLPGYQAYRNPVLGSYYIQALMEEFTDKNNINLDIQKLLRMVQERVRENAEVGTDVEGQTVRYQMPAYSPYMFADFSFGDNGNI